MAAFARRYLLYREAPRGRNSAFLWPIYVHRVIYPAERQSTLNLFQRAVLGLVRTGCNVPGEVAEHLGLHPEMALLIIAQCQSRNWLDDGAKLTPEGAQLLTDDQDGDFELKTGLLFQDAITGSLWPRLSGELNELEAEGEDRPSFVLNRSRGYATRPFLIAPRSAGSSSLDRRQLLDAYRRYRIDHFNAMQLYGRDALPRKVEINGIELSSERPEPMYVLTWLVPNGNGSRPWRILDPFGIREEVTWLDETFASLVPGNNRLTRELARVLDTPQPESQSVEEWMRSMDQMIDLEMLHHHEWASRQPLIAKSFLTLRRRVELMDQGLGQYELEPALTDAQKLCEAVCQWLLQAFKPDMGFFPKLQSHDRDMNKRILKALDLPALTDQGIDKLSGQQLYQVRHALEGRSQSLKAMLFGVALSTLNQEGHPFRSLPAEQLAVDMLLQLAELRNEASHANRKTFSQDEVHHLATFALNWTLLFKEWM